MLRFGPCAVRHKSLMTSTFTPPRKIWNVISKKLEKKGSWLINPKKGNEYRDLSVTWLAWSLFSGDPKLQPQKQSSIQAPNWWETLIIGTFNKKKKKDLHNVRSHCHIKTLILPTASWQFSSHGSCHNFQSWEGIIRVHTIWSWVNIWSAEPIPN